MDLLQKAWFYLKKIGWLILVIVGLLLVVYSTSRKGKRKQEIQAKLNELNKIENKTEADIKEAERLTEEAKAIDKTINEIGSNYKKKVEELSKRPDHGKKRLEDPKPGEAGRSSDDLTNAWK